MRISTKKNIKKVCDILLVVSCSEVEEICNKKVPYKLTDVMKLVWFDLETAKFNELYVYESEFDGIILYNSELEYVAKLADYNSTSVEFVINLTKYAFGIANNIYKV